MPTLLSAPEAAAYLDIKTETLYAYVSRGLIDSVPGLGDGRRRAYRQADLDRLKRRSDAHSGHGAAASSALDWGAPSLDTALSQITADGAAYRGRSVADLVREGVGYEAVADFLWTGLWKVQPPGQPGQPPGRPGRRDEPTRQPGQPPGESPAGAWPWPDARSQPVLLHDLLARDAWPIDVLRVAVTLAGFEDLARFGATPDAELQVARDLVTRAVASLAAHRAAIRPAVGPGDAPAWNTIAEGVAAAFGREATPDVVRAIDGALVVVADHELNASTFSSRVTASTGADVYACVSAALATFTGARHGGACDQCAALVAEVEARGSARAVLTERVRRGEAPPGFGHRLYPDGDPRFGLLTGLATGVSGRPDMPWLAELLSVASDMELGAPTSDLGLVILCRSLRLPSEAAVTLFAVGRMAGWIAHAHEQRRQGFMLRPRARYIGV